MDAPTFENLDLACAKVGKLSRRGRQRILRSSLRTLSLFWKSRGFMPCFFF